MSAENRLALHPEILPFSYGPLYSGTSAMKPVLNMDGGRFDDFAREVSAQPFGGEEFNGNLDAFNDMLRGGFGTPAGGFVLRWVNSARSRAVLGHAATARWYESNLKTCHPSNLRDAQEGLAAARRGEGPTLFDTVVDIIRAHGWLPPKNWTA